MLWLDTSKTCNKCGLSKDLIEFNKSKRNVGGYKTICRECQSEEGKEYNARSETKKKRAEYAYEYLKRPGKRDARNAAQRKHSSKPEIKQKRAKQHIENKAHPGWGDLTYFRHLKYEVGVEKDAYFAALIEQGYMCGNRGCGQGFDESGRHAGGKYNGRRAHVDHNHTFGHFRGLLCENCNKAEGVLITVKSAEGMAEYMRKDMIICEGKTKK